MPLGHFLTGLAQSNPFDRYQQLKDWQDNRAARKLQSDMMKQQMEQMGLAIKGMEHQHALDTDARTLQSYWTDMANRSRLGQIETDTAQRRFNYEGSPEFLANQAWELENARRLGDLRYATEDLNYRRASSPLAQENYEWTLRNQMTSGDIDTALQALNYGVASDPRSIGDIFRGYERTEEMHQANLDMLYRQLQALETQGVIDPNTGLNYQQLSLIGFPHEFAVEFADTGMKSGDAIGYYKLLYGEAGAGAGSGADSSSFLPLGFNRSNTTYTGYSFVDDNGAHQELLVYVEPAEYEDTFFYGEEPELRKPERVHYIATDGREYSVVPHDAIPVEVRANFEADVARSLEPEPEPVEPKQGYASKAWSLIKNAIFPSEPNLNVPETGTVRELYDNKPSLQFGGGRGEYLDRATGVTQSASGDMLIRAERTADEVVNEAINSIDATAQTEGLLANYNGSYKTFYHYLNSLPGDAKFAMERKWGVPFDLVLQVIHRRMLLNSPFKRTE